MGFKEQMEDDLVEVFFNEKDFSESSIYFPRTGGQVLLLGIFDQTHIDVDVGAEALVSSSEIKFLIREKSLEKLPEPGDKVAIRGKLFQLINSKPNGVGVIELVLRYERVYP